MRKSSPNWPGSQQNAKFQAVTPNAVKRKTFSTSLINNINIFTYAGAPAYPPKKNIMFDKVYKNKRVLITGHTGFKGSWLAIWLKELGADVIGYSLAPPCGKILKNIPDPGTSAPMTAAI